MRFKWVEHMSRTAETLMATMTNYPIRNYFIFLRINKAQIAFSTIPGVILTTIISADITAIWCCCARKCPKNPKFFGSQGIAVGPVRPVYCNCSIYAFNSGCRAGKLTSCQSFAPKTRSYIFIMLIYTSITRLHV